MIKSSLKTRKRRKYDGNKIIFLHKSISKRLFYKWISQFAKTRRADARGALTSFTVCDAYRCLAGQAYVKN